MPKIGTNLITHEIPGILKVQLNDFSFFGVHLKVNYSLTNNLTYKME